MAAVRIKFFDRSLVRGLLAILIFIVLWEIGARSKQWLGLDGELLAWECAAHCGLHFNSEKAELEDVGGELVVTSWNALRTPVLRMGTGWTAEIEPLLCSCGDARPLLRHITARKQSLVLRQAHAAAGA